MGQSQERIDIRVMKTQRAIRETFEAMVLEMDVSKITVKELTERASIHRKTFYLHYQSIEALFDDSLTRIMDDFFAHHETTPALPKDIKGHAERFFLYLAGQSDYVERLICRTGHYDFGGKLYFEQMMRYRSAGDPFGWMPEEEEVLLLSMIRIIALEFYRQWVQGGKRVQPEKAAQLLSELTCNGVSNLMK